MSQSGPSAAGAVTFEQLIALNDEMAALVRAGVPLERGLAALGRDLPGRSGRLAGLLARRMSAGETLPQILAAESETFPPVWRAVVEAGLRSGQLAGALESLSATARRTAELRKTIGAALLYPLLVVALAYGMFVFGAIGLAPRTFRAYQSLTGQSEPMLAGVAWLGENAWWWAPWTPLAAAMLVGIWWYRSASAAWSLGRRPKAAWPRRWFSLRFGLGSVLGDERMAAFGEILGLLVKQQVPLPQAVPLAAEACGDAAMRGAAQRVADRLKRGELLAKRDDLPAGFPPVLGWLLMSRAQPSELARALARTAEGYRERAARTALGIAVYLPIGLTVLVAGTAVLLEALVTFLPVWRLLYILGMPI